MEADNLDMTARKGGSLPLATDAETSSATPSPGACAPGPQTGLRRVVPYALCLFAVTLLTTCTYPSADFSSVSGINLIPNNQFGLGSSYVWTADADSQGHSTSATGPANSSDWYVNFYRVDGVSGDYGGYTDDTALLSGLPATVPVYRLETKNLLANGDFEGGTPFMAVGTSTIGSTPRVAVASAATTGSLDTTTYAMTGNWGLIALSGGDCAEIDLSINLSDYSTYASAPQYALGFRIKLDQALSYALGADYSTDTSGSGAQIMPLGIATGGVDYRYPYNVSAASANFTTYDGGHTYGLLRLQPLPFPTTSYAGQPWHGTIDNVQIVRADRDNAIRLVVPWQTDAGISLQHGGTYTLKFYVRSDLTVPYSGGAVSLSNRAAASTVSVSVHELTSASVAGHGAVVNHTILDSTVTNAVTYSNWNNWTLLSSSFSGLLSSTSSSPTGAALQITISTTNMNSAALRSPGSILVANPTLIWTP